MNGPDTEFDQFLGTGKLHSSQATNVLRTEATLYEVTSTSAAGRVDFNSTIIARQASDFINGDKHVQW